MIFLQQTVLHLSITFTLQMLLKSQKMNLFSETKIYYVYFLLQLNRLLFLTWFGATCKSIKNKWHIYTTSGTDKLCLAFVTLVANVRYLAFPYFMLTFAIWSSKFLSNFTHLWKWYFLNGCVIEFVFKNLKKQWCLYFKVKY